MRRHPFGQHALTASKEYPSGAVAGSKTQVYATSIGVTGVSE